MKFAAFVILSCLCVYASCAQESTWGNTITATGVHDVGGETINVPSSLWKTKTHRFTYPRDGVTLNVPIAGIKHIDYKQHPVKVDIVAGGVGFHTVTIDITSQKSHGINSQFIIYTR